MLFGWQEKGGRHYWLHYRVWQGQNGKFGWTDCSTRPAFIHSTLTRAKFEAEVYEKRFKRSLQNAA